MKKNFTALTIKKALALVTVTALAGSSLLCGCGKKDEPVVDTTTQTEVDTTTTTDTTSDVVVDDTNVEEPVADVVEETSYYDKVMAFLEKQDAYTRTGYNGSEIFINFSSNQPDGQNIVETNNTIVVGKGNEGKFYIKEKTYLTDEDLETLSNNLGCAKEDVYYHLGSLKNVEFYGVGDRFYYKDAWEEQATTGSNEATFYGDLSDTSSIWKFNLEPALLDEAHQPTLNFEDGEWVDNGDTVTYTFVEDLGFKKGDVYPFDAPAEEIDKVGVSKVYTTVITFEKQSDDTLKPVSIVKTLDYDKIYFTLTEADSNGDRHYVSTDEMTGTFTVWDITLTYEDNVDWSIIDTKFTELGVE